MHLPVKQAAMKIPPPIYALSAAFLMWATTRLPAPGWNIPALAFFGYAFIAAGLLIDLSAIWQFRRVATTINPMRPENSTSLVTSGIFSYTRNPMYLGMVFILTGVAILLQNLLPFLVIPAFIWLLTKVQIIPEERALTGLFGDIFTNYTRTTRRWL